MAQCLSTILKMQAHDLQGLTNGKTLLNSKLC